jgi:hypothetical protein
VVTVVGAVAAGMEEEAVGEVLVLVWGWICGAWSFWPQSMLCGRLRDLPRWRTLMEVMEGAARPVVALRGKAEGVGKARGAVRKGPRRGTKQAQRPISQRVVPRRWLH